VKLSLVIPVVLALACLAGCQKDIQNKDAVRQGVINYLTQNKNLSIGSMDIEVTQVNFKGNVADATVQFKPKGGDAASGMTMHYTLEQQANGWVVKKKADNGHGMTSMPQGGAMPGTMPGAMPMPSSAMPMPSGGMPAGHPPAAKPENGK
jgi:hypothetical protein